MKRRHLPSLLAAFALVACDAATPPQDPITPYLPSLPPTGGPAVAAAGQLTEANFATERVPGPASQGLPGDYFLRNDKIRVVVQAPGRFIGPCPFGGDIIDVDRVDAPAGDQLGEVSLFLQLGRTVDFQQPTIVRDGSQGGPAVLRFIGHDVQDDFINLTGMGGIVADVIGDDYRATVDLGLEVAVTYVLAPGATAVDVYYSFYNPSQDARATMWGTMSDTGAQIEVFHAGVGYGESDMNELVAGSLPLVDHSVLQGQGIAYGTMPVGTSGGELGFAVAGVDVEAYELAAIGDVFGAKGQSLAVPAQGGTQRHIAVMVAGDAGGIESQVRALRGEATGTVDGKVGTASGQAAAGARVIVEDLAASDPRQVLVTAFVTDGTGAFHGALRPGSYRLTAESDGFLRSSDPQTISIVAGNAASATLLVPDAALLAYTIHDRAGHPLPARITVVGAPPATPDRRFRDLRDYGTLGVAASLASKDGDSSKMTRWDHPIALAPGHYRVVVGHGPEWSRFEQVIDLAAAGATVDATLDRVVDTSGYLACDFHQHSNLSPDSPVPAEDRVVTYLAEGVELVSSSDHDFHTDYKPTIHALDADGALDAMVGVEVTPWDYGHFIGFPMRVDMSSPNHGALDWGNNPAGLDLAPSEIFAGLRSLGAEVVQVNHPRAAPGTDVVGNFQNHFDRCGLAFDFSSHSFGGKVALQPVKAIELGLPDGAELFSPDFDTLEVYNGFHYQDGPGGPSDVVTDQRLRDWMNFLSFGFTPTAVGDSDSHEWSKSIAGLPRTLVRVPDDSQAAIAMGVAEDVVRTVKGGAMPRDVIVTNGPFVTLTVDNAGIGQLAPHASGPLAIHVTVATPDWAPIDTVEIYANATFDVPPPDPNNPEPFAPVLCFTTRGAPTQACANAVGGARPLTLSTVEVAPGANRLEATIDVSIDPAELLARQRQGAQGQDLWLVARTLGQVGLFPTIPSGLGDASQVPAIVDGGTSALAGVGVPALAFTNPVFVDVDGGGWKAPFAQ